jgi:hypothetical protein
MALLFAKNNSLSAVTELPASLSRGALTLISTQTASSSANISFTSGIDSTYKEYIFKFINIHPATDGAEFTINFSTDSGSNYNVAKTTSFFVTYNAESEASSGITYINTLDAAQGTGGANIFYNVGNENDEAASGTLHLFEPSSTTFVKHFFSIFNVYNNSGSNGNSVQVNVAGCGNTTSAIDAVQFAMSSGNIDSGTFKLYGVS